MKVIFISGDGHGAGKTYLARKLAASDENIFSVANLIRLELSKEFKKYDWYNKSPDYKTKTIVKETKLTIKQMLEKRGTEKKARNQYYWAHGIAELLIYEKNQTKLNLAVIDDIRYCDELRYIRNKLSTEDIVHLHVVNANAIPEPIYENEKLRELADYHIVRYEKK